MIIRVKLSVILLIFCVSFTGNVFLLWRLHRATTAAGGTAPLRNVANVTLPTEPWSPTVSDKPAIHIFTAVPLYLEPMGDHAAMYQRQFAIMNEEEEIEMSCRKYDQTFLNTNGNSHVDEDLFHDTLYVEHPQDAFFNAISEKFINDKDALFIYQATPIHKFPAGLVDQIVNKLDYNTPQLFCLLGIGTDTEDNQKYCIGDVFALNLLTAITLREQYLLKKYLVESDYIHEIDFVPTEPGQLYEELFPMYHRQLKELREEYSIFRKNPMTFSKLSQMVNFDVTPPGTVLIDLFTNGNITDQIKSYTHGPFEIRKEFTVNETNTDQLPEIYGRDEPQEDINIINFPNSACSKGAFVSLVKSAPGEFAERMAIRNSYIAMSTKWNFTYDLYFLLGTSDQSGISTEQVSFGDLIIGDFPDTYDNLPLKTFMAFQFFGNNCYWKKKKMMILQDTDCFISLYDILVDYGIIPGTDRMGNPRWMGYQVLIGEDNESLYCLRGYALPNKEMNNGSLYIGKWWIKLSQWPPKFAIPKYCNGSCNSMTAAAAYKIWLAAKRTSRHDLRIEDLFFLGILRHKAGIPDTSVYGLHDYLNGGMKFLEFRLSWNRCLHLKDAMLFSNTSKRIVLPNSPKTDLFDSPLRSQLEVMDYLTDWYVNGQWHHDRTNFTYHGKIANRLNAFT